MQAIVRARELTLVVDDMTASGVNQISQTDVSLPEPENPYKGLHAFQTADAQDFFGRTELVQKLIDRMCTDDAYQRFLAIVGPSGSGKSSLVRAGVTPALWKDAIEGSGKWFVVDMIPGTHPIDKLALIRVAANQANNLREQLQRDERGLLRASDIILPNDNTELVIVIDQFEEVFTVVEHEAVRQHFLNLLLTAVSDVRSRVRVIVTMRADYYDRPLHYPEFGQLVRTRMETILPLSAKGLERAIRGPAERVGVTFEQGLVEQIVSEMNYQSGALPLLQYALTELFDRRDGRLLTNDTYQQIGGAVGALANRADEIYQSLTNEGQELAHQMFMRMVTLGEGAEDTRKRTPQSDLLALTENTDLVEEIIGQFAAYRLLSLDHDPETRQPTVEVAHEAILREWERLRMWLNESRDEIRLQQQLSYAAKEWRDAQQDKSFLLRGSRLQQFEAWVQLTELILTKKEQDFLQASIVERKRQDDIETKRVEGEQKQEKRSRTLLRSLVAVFAVASILSGGLGIFAIIQRNDAIDALDVSQRSSQAFAANAAVQVNEIDLAIALAQESAGDGTDLLPETIRVIEELEIHPGPTTLQSVGYYCGPSISRTLRYAVYSNCENQLVIWDIETVTQIAQFPHPEGIFDWRMSGDGTFLVGIRNVVGESRRFGLHGIDVYAWDVINQQLITQYRIEEPQLFWQFSSLYAGGVLTYDGSMLLTAEMSEEGIARYQAGEMPVPSTFSLRDVMTNEILHQYSFEGEPMQIFDVSPDGKLGVPTGWTGFDGIFEDDNRVIVFDIQTGDVLYRYDLPIELPDVNYDIYEPGFASFNDDASMIFLASIPNYIIDTHTGEEIGRLTSVEGFAMAGRPSNDFQHAIIFDLGANGDPQYVDVMTSEVDQYQVNQLYTTSLTDMLVSNDNGRTDEFQMWDINGRDSRLATLIQRGSTSVSTYSPDGQYLAVTDGGINIRSHSGPVTIYDP